MKHIILDLEMNNISKQHKALKPICDREIIEIGAVVLDGKYQEIGSFKTYVKPQLNDAIQPNITKLTGITKETVQDAPEFELALNMFFSWCNSMNDDICIYQWSESDYSQITKEIELKNIAINTTDLDLLENWIDLQKEFGQQIGLVRSISLKDAVMYAGIDFEGNAHDALFDARNTGLLLQIIRNPEKNERALDRVIEALKPKHETVTLGELFNFSGLVIA